MILSVMQPYFFPHTAYYTQVAASSEFILFDDVNFIKGGWINRNYLNFSGPTLFSIPLIKQSQNRLIKDHVIFKDKQLDKLMSRIKLFYAKSPYFDITFNMIQDALSEDTIAEAAHKSLTLPLDYLGLNYNVSKSSDLDYDRSGNGQDKILSICKIKKPTVYLNASGGQHLYDSKRFDPIELCFMPKIEKSLSIIDLLMNQTPEQIREQLCTKL